ncbi:ParA family protein [Clostridium botulinum]|uniref:ParA family protein n=1 Tax=Clostridium botulinum TaxID=1491 RepID=UPI0022469DC6|nr:ParA family protein [Clostridium botulinum]UZP01907.1 ParA family protein [Clostridium botulinum]UZP05265.1 ParA family protein [Clostridium botulinum]UZP08646.1 ParA family protein [Clostridium botulinum]
MRTISIINLKGGVAKTVSSVNISHILATNYDKRVLLIDNDKQGNATKMFSLHDEEELSIADIMCNPEIDVEDVIIPTQYKNLDLIPANMRLLKANLDVIKDDDKEQQTILKRALSQVCDNYDYCIIDNPPDINISVINSLVSCEDVLIPIKIDKFAFDGLEELNEQIENVKQINPKIKLKGCFITQYQNNDVNNQGEEVLIKNNKYPMFKTHIRRTPKVDESTFASLPVCDYSKRCAASKDYLQLVEEYLDLEV